MVSTFCFGPVCIPVWHVLAIAAFLVGPCLRLFIRLKNCRSNAPSVKLVPLRPTEKMEVLPIRTVTSWENIADILSDTDLKLEVAFGSSSPTEDRRILIKYSAEWCRPCKAIQPFIEKMNSCYQCLFLQVDIMKTEDLSDVNSIPTFRLYTWSNPSRSILKRGRPGLGMTLTQEITGADVTNISTMLATHCTPYADSVVLETAATVDEASLLGVERKKNM